MHQGVRQCGGGADSHAASPTFGGDSVRPSGVLLSRAAWLLALALMGLPDTRSWAETCTTQSAMQPGDREALAEASREIAGKMQTGDLTGLQAQTVAEFASNFGGIRQAVQELEPHLQGDSLVLDDIFLLDATGLGAGAEAQFFCTLNRSQADVDLSINGLTSGVYGFAVVRASGSSPWRISMLLRRDNGRWLLAGFFPGATTAAGHDGVWYWREARRLAVARQIWSAWLFFGEARALLQPAPFVQSSHLERLEDERKSAAPPALSAGISATTPLVVKGVDTTEYRFTALSADSVLGRDKLDVLAHVEGQAGDAAALRSQGDGAARALLAAYPELRSSFGGVLIALDLPGSTQPLITERPIAEIH